MKLILGFVFGNAFWDYLVSVFGSSEAVVAAALVIVGIIFFIKYHQEIFGFAIILLILYIIFK